jgi:hypothetical protein
MKRTYVVQGRYGYFAVDELNDHDSGRRGPLFTGTRKQATAVAGALNAAYTMGREDQTADSRDLVERAYVAGALQYGPPPLESVVSRETEAATEAPWCSRCGLYHGWSTPHRSRTLP